MNNFHSKIKTAISKLKLKLQCVDCNFGLKVISLDNKLRNGKANRITYHLY